MANGKVSKRKSNKNENPRRGFDCTDDYRFLSEFLIVLEKEEFENLKVTPKDVDIKLKRLFLKRAKDEFKINEIPCPRLTIKDVTLCECNKRVGIVNNSRLGDFQGDPIRNAGGRPQGDPLRDTGGRPKGDVNSYITLNELVGQSGFIHHSCCCSKSNVEVRKPKNAKQIGVLDTAVDVKFVYEYMSVHYPKVDRSLFSIVNKSCQHTGLSSNSGHGTMVVICLLEKLYANNRKKKQPVCINVYNVARDILLPGNKLPTQIIAQSDVICELYKAVEDGNKLLNMSFGFTYQVHLIEKVIEEILPMVKIITCSAGNDGFDLTDGQHVNYPSAFARDFDTKKIKEVTGFMLDGNNKKVPWEKNAIVQTNKIKKIGNLDNYKRCMENAVLDEHTNSGGTSFSSPRLLGTLI